jgi:nitrilase
MIKRNVSVLGIQLTSTSSLEDNLLAIENELSSTNLSSIDIVVLPEMFAQFGVKNQVPLAEQEATFKGPVGNRIREFAKHYNVWIVAGTVPVLVEGEPRPRARCHVIDSAGNVEAVYDKIHLFDADVSDKQGAYRESDSYSPGSTPTVIDTPWGKVGLAVCYDLRFPELFKALADLSCELVIVPSAFTRNTGEAHWEVLCRARAIENGYFVVAVNQCGEHDSKRSTWGHSMCVDPWGRFESMGHKTGSLSWSLDLSDVMETQNQIPVHKNRQL